MLWIEADNDLLRSSAHNDVLLWKRVEDGMAKRTTARDFRMMWRVASRSVRVYLKPALGSSYRENACLSERENFAKRHFYADIVRGAVDEYDISRPRRLRVSMLEWDKKGRRNERGDMIYRFQRKDKVDEADIGTMTNLWEKFTIEATMDFKKTFHIRGGRSFG